MTNKTLSFNSLKSPLDTNTELVRHNEEIEIKKALSQNFRHLLYDMRQIGKTILTNEEYKEKKQKKKTNFRHTFCGFATVENHVKIVKANGGKFMYNGVASCSAVWRCPVCSIKILKGRAKELYGITSRHLKTGKMSGFVTLTVRHNKKQSLKTTLNKLLIEYRKFQNLRFFRSIKKSGVYLGQIKSLEITHTKANGWHPHLHIIYCWNSKIESEVDALQNDIIIQWANYSGGSVDAQDQKPIFSVGEVADYVTKWDSIQELTNDMSKNSKGVKPFGILTMLAKNESLYDFGPEESIKKLKFLFAEYVEATKGKHRIGISRELNKIYSIESKTDEELTNEIEIEEIIIEFCRQTWAVICENNLQPYLIDICYDNEKNKDSQKLEIFNILSEFEHFRKTTTKKGQTLIVKECPL